MAKLQESPSQEKEPCCTPRLQKLDGEATREGLWLTSTMISGGERLQVSATAVGRVGANAAVLPTTGSVRVRNSLVCWERTGVTEEYSVSVDGVRQDFIIGQRLPGEGGLRVELKVTGATAKTMAGGTKLTLDSGRREIAYSRLNVVDAGSKILAAYIEVASSTCLVVRVDDADADYPVRIDPTFSDANWISLGGLPGVDGSVSALVVNTNTGRVYIGGAFTIAGTVLANNIAQWDGSVWSPLGSGISGQVNALALDESGNLYAGGVFTSAGGVSATNIARWDGNVWSPLGSGIGGRVFALALDALGNLYTGGLFASAGGASATNIARWSGSEWSALGSGVNDVVLALAADGSGNLFAGGRFTAAGGLSASKIAKWSGSEWSALGSGISDGFLLRVYALAVDGAGNLYVGGGFTTAGGASATNIAKWNGSGWSTLGPGVDNTVKALACDGSGNLYAGGLFHAAGSVTGNCIAVWSGYRLVTCGLGNEQHRSSVGAGWGEQRIRGRQFFHCWSRIGKRRRGVGRGHMVGSGLGCRPGHE